MSPVLPAVALFDNNWAPTMTFAYSLGRRGVPLHVYGSGASGWSRYCTERRNCPPPENTAVFLPWLRDLLRTGEITRIAPTTDLIAYYCSLLRDEFPAAVQRAIAPLPEIENALIKSRFCAACDAVGQPFPQVRTPDSLEAAVSAAQELGYPLILKPKSHLAVGTAERGGLIHDEAELRAEFHEYSITPGQESLAARYPELRWPLLQRYIPSARSRVYSLTGIKDCDGGILTAALSYKSKQWPPDIGTSIAQLSHVDESIMKAALPVVDQLVSRGLFELELVVGDSQLLAIDWNPRAYGFIKLDVARGHDLPWLWMCSTLGPVEPLALPPEAELLEARHTLLYFLKLAADLRLRGAARPRHEPDTKWISIMGHPGDPVPMMIGYLSMLRHPRSLIRSQFVTAREWSGRSVGDGATAQ
jgi:D-aspartate ligase